MTTQEALDFLEKVTAGISGTRQDHINIQTALNVISRLIEKPDEAVKVKK